MDWAAFRRPSAKEDAVKKTILIALVIGFTALAAAPAAGGDNKESLEKEIAALRAQASPLEQLFIKVPELVKPSVVTMLPVKIVKTAYGRGRGRDPFMEHFFGDEFFNRFFGRGAPQDREQRFEGLGSGVILDARGYILTNNHVVADADELKVRLADGTELPGTIVGTDTKTDLAVVKVEARNLRPAKLGNSDKLRVGSWVIAIGSPLQLEQTITQGIVSAKGRGNLRLAAYEDFIQTDAAINPGNSGGPLVNLSGEVVGINTAIASYSGGYQGVGFAIPINMAKLIMDSLIKDGKVVRGWMGVGIQPLDEDLARELNSGSTEGVLVSQVFEDYPAAAAGLKARDIILQYNGKPVKDVAQLRMLVASTPVNNDVDVVLVREGKKINRKLKITEYPETPPVVEGGEYESQKLGLAVTMLPAEAAEQLGLPASAQAVVVVKVARRGIAAGVLAVGDIIAEMDKKPIRSLKDFADAESNANFDEGVLLLVQRRNRRFYVVVK